MSFYPRKAQVVRHVPALSPAADEMDWRSWYYLGRWLKNDTLEKLGKSFPRQIEDHEGSSYYPLIANGYLKRAWLHADKSYRKSEKWYRVTKKGREAYASHLLTPEGEKTRKMVA